MKELVSDFSGQTRQAGLPLMADIEQLHKSGFLRAGQGGNDYEAR